MSESSRVNSPCIGKCVVHDGLCIGCLRTLDEVRVWRDASEQERANILHCVDIRKSVINVEVNRDYDE